MDNQEIKKIINQYNRKREREKKNYHEKLKCDSEWCEKNKKRALDYYNTNKDKKKEDYKKDKEFVNSGSMFQYYKRNNRIEEFKEKYPEKYELLKSRGINVEVPPPEEENKIILSFS